MRVYFDFLGKRQMEKIKVPGGRGTEYRIKNNGEIVFDYSSAEKAGISRKHFRDAIDQLIEHGFLDISHRGSGGQKGDVTLYKLDSRWKDYGTPSFQHVKPRTKDVRGARGWVVYNAQKQKVVVLLAGLLYVAHWAECVLTAQTSVSKTTPKNEALGVEINTPSRPETGASSVEINTPNNEEVALTG